jgi:hypothetical protein
MHTLFKVKYLFITLICVFTKENIFGQDYESNSKGFSISIAYKFGIGKNSIGDGLAMLDNDNRAPELSLAYHFPVSQKINLGVCISQMRYRRTPDFNVSTLSGVLLYTPFEHYRRFYLKGEIGYSFQFSDIFLKGFTFRLKPTWNTKMFNKDIIHLFAEYYFQNSENQESFIFILDPSDPNGGKSMLVIDNVIHHFVGIGLSFKI